jgi:hypothetical protein
MGTKSKSFIKWFMLFVIIIGIPVFFLFKGAFARIRGSSVYIRHQSIVHAIEEYDNSHDQNLPDNLKQIHSMDKWNSPLQVEFRSSAWQKKGEPMLITILPNCERAITFGDKTYALIKYYRPLDENSRFGHNSVGMSTEIPLICLWLCSIVLLTRSIYKAKKEARSLLKKT